MTPVLCGILWRKTVKHLILLMSSTMTVNIQAPPAYLLPSFPVGTKGGSTGLDYPKWDPTTILSFVSVFPYLSYQGVLCVSKANKNVSCIITTIPLNVRSHQMQREYSTCGKLFLASTIQHQAKSAPKSRYFNLSKWGKFVSFAQL